MNIYDSSGAKVYPLKTPGWIKSFSHDSVRKDSAQQTSFSQGSTQRSLSDAVLERASQSAGPDPHHVFNVPELVTHYENITRVASPRSPESKDVGIATSFRGTADFESHHNKKFQSCDNINFARSSDSRKHRSLGVGNYNSFGDERTQKPNPKPRMSLPVTGIPGKKPNNLMSSSDSRATGFLDRALADIERGDYVSYNNCDTDIDSQFANASTVQMASRNSSAPTREPMYVNDFFHSPSNNERKSYSETKESTGWGTHSKNEIDKVQLIVH